MRSRQPRSWPSFADPPRKAAEAMRRLEDITRLVSDWVWETDPDFRLIYVSQRVTESLRYHPMQLVGKTLAGIGTFAANDGGPAPDWHKPFRDFPFEARDSEGHPRWMLVSSLPVFEPETGQFMGARGVVRDITERRQVELALQKSEERHRNFAADVAHELRTPLAVLRSHLDNIGVGDPAGTLRQEVDAMARMVEQILAASRLERLTVAATEAADLHALAVKVAAYLGPIAIKESRSIEVIGTDGPVVVRGNADALEQALRNLVENAIRYSARRTTITIEVTPGSLRVIDRGRGIPADTRHTIFERFTRADRRGGGIGLGLSIVRRTVEAHEAAIEVGDTPGGGATFTIRFPPHAAQSR